jgi:DNA-binding GntR family transcriptional regulator
MSVAPAYHRVAGALRADIQRGRWKVGERIPTETELSAQFDVSRNTVRQALDILHSMNLVSRQQGRGTFVAPHGLSHMIGELKSLTDVLRERGLVPGTEGIKVAIDPRPPIDAIEHLGSSTIWRVDRVRTTDGRPFCDMSSWLPDELGRRLDVNRLIQDGSLYRILKDDLGILLTEATEIIRAEGATAEEASALSIRRGTPVIVMYRWVSDNRGRPVEYARAAAPGDRYQYLAKLRA